MTKTSKVIGAVTLIEAVLTVYYFYIQPKCEPCLPNSYCPPCISQAQIVILWTGAFVGLVAIIFLCYRNLRRTENGM